MRPPCKECPERHELCHATCVSYLAYRAERDKVNADKLATMHLLWSDEVKQRASRKKLNRYKRDH